MKLFLMLFIFAVTGCASVSIQRTPSAPEKSYAGDSAYVVGDLSIALDSTSEHMLFETETKWVTVGCYRSRDLQFSHDEAENSAQISMGNLLLFLAKAPELLIRDVRTRSWRQAVAIHGAVSGMRMALVRPADEKITGDVSTFTTCVAEVADKSVMSLEYVRKTGTLKYDK